jgi:hypothetical protein
MDGVYGFWYRIKTGTTLAIAEIYSILYAAKPDPMQSFKGVVEFQNKAFYWGGESYQNRLFHTQTGTHDIVNGSDAGYTSAFGGADEILCAKKWYDDLLVWKNTGLYLLTGDSAVSYRVLPICEGIGLSSPKTALIIADEYPSSSQDDPLAVVIWQDADGVYVLDKQKPIKISDPVNHYFDPTYTTAVGESALSQFQAFIDKYNREYHLVCLGEELELVYNYVTDEWYPPFEREIPVSCALSVKSIENRYYLMAGTGQGFAIALEQGIDDVSTTGAACAVSHWIKTRNIGSDLKLNVALDFEIYDLWAECKTQSSGSITTTMYKDQAITGEELSTPQAMSLVKSGYRITTPKLQVCSKAESGFQFLFFCNAIGVAMEIYSVIYSTTITRELAA